MDGVIKRVSADMNDVIKRVSTDTDDVISSEYGYG